MEKLNRVFEAYYYFSEAYVNTAIALLPPTVILIIYGREVLHTSTANLTILFILSLAAQALLYWSGYVTSMKHHAAYRDAVKGALDFRDKQ